MLFSCCNALQFLLYLSTSNNVGEQLNSVFLFPLTLFAAIQISLNKRKFLHKKRVRSPHDLFGSPTWPPFHCMVH